MYFLFVISFIISIETLFTLFVCKSTFVCASLLMNVVILVSIFLTNNLQELKSRNLSDYEEKPPELLKEAINIYFFLKVRAEKIL